MTENEQRICIAQACGYKNVHLFDSWKEGYPHSDGTIVGDFNGRTRIAVPDYLGNLNAMHEAEKTLTRAQKEIYWDHLLTLCGHTEMVFAASKQRAKAFVMTLNFRIE